MGSQLISRPYFPQIQQLPADRQLHQQQPETACNNGLQRQQLPAPAGSSSLQQHQQPQSACNNGLQQLPAAAAPVTVADPAVQSSSVQVTSPRMTRSRKKRKAVSPASPAECSGIEQVDRPAPSPPPSPEDCRPPSAPSSPGCARTPSPTPPVPWAPPPAPPWSRFLPSHPRTVICAKCFSGMHGLGFLSCFNCFQKGNAS